MKVNRPINPQPGELRCPRCFALDIVPSLPRGIKDAVMRVFRRVPRHCRACARRFYVRRDPGTRQAEAPAPPAS